MYERKTNCGRGVRLPPKSAIQERAEWESLRPKKGSHRSFYRHQGSPPAEAGNRPGKRHTQEDVTKWVSW